MKRIASIWLAGVVLTGIAVSASYGQNSEPQEPSLGSYARSVRKDKKSPAAKHFDNDNLPTNDKLSVVGSAPGNPADPQLAEQTQATPSSDPGPKTAVAPGESAESRQRVYDHWQQQITDQQAQVELVARELDVAQREYRLRAAAMYADAGDRMRNQTSWDKEDADYKTKIADKQKALQDAKDQLANLQEEARKSGVPSSAREPEHQ
jgi:hypothetical protein